MNTSDRNVLCGLWSQPTAPTEVWDRIRADGIYGLPGSILESRIITTALLDEPIFDYVRDSLKKAVIEAWRSKPGEICIWYCDLEEIYKDINEAKQNWAK